MARTHITSADKTHRSGFVSLLNDMFTELYAACAGTAAVKFTPYGGVAVQMLNRTGSTTVKGTLVTTHATYDNAVTICSVDVPNCIGVFLETGGADDTMAWVVISGMAEVYFSGSATRGHMARVGVSQDIGEVNGQAISEAVPTSPFATDKHFAEIGHVAQSRTGAGLARVVLHFN
jgi:hypothetical protein